MAAPKPRQPPAAPTPAEAWLVVYAAVLESLICRLPLGPVSGADRHRCEAEAATAADESLELWKRRFAA